MGKNKKKHDAGEHSPATVFVNNLPYTFTNSQLEETFSDVGPIRRCFMVTKKGSTEHRGFGYVQFAVTEDANRAIELKHGSSVGGRTVGVKHATHRAPLEQRRPKGNEVVPSDDAVKAKDGEDDMDDDITKTKDSKDDSLLHVDDIVKTKDDNDDSSTPIVKRKKTRDSQEKGKIDKPKKTVIASEDELVEDDSSTPIAKPKKASDSKKKEKVDKLKKAASPLKTELLEDDSSTPIVKTKKASDSKKKGKADKPKTPVTPVKAERVEGISSEKQRVARTVVVGNLLNTKIAEDAHRLARECGSVSSITYPLPKEELTHHGLLQDGCRLGASSIVYASVKSARACVTKLHQKNISGVTIWACQLGGEAENETVNSSSSVAVTPVIPVVNAPLNVLSESSSLESHLIPAVGDSANMHSSPLGKTESSPLDGVTVQNIEVAIKGMSVDEKVNTSSLEEKIADDEPLADATKQERKDISKCSLKDAPLFKSLLKDATKQERKDLFKSLLKDSNVSSDWTWEQALRVIINDIRLIALDTKAERDQTFNEYIEQRKKEEDFKRMLEDSRELTASMTWSKAVALFENDKRYKAVDQASDREDLFRSYCVDQQKKYHEDKSRVEGALNLKKVTVLTTWTFEDFKASIGKDIISSLSYFNLQRVFLDLIEMEKEKEKELKKRQCLAKDFTELLNNMEDITASSTWEECHHLLKESSEYRAISDETIAHEIFTEHVACLAEKAQKKRKREDEKARKEDKMKRKEKEKERLKKDYSDSTEHEENKKREKDEDRKRRKFRHHGSDQIRSREDASSRDSRKHHRHSSDHEKTRKDASSRDSRKHHRHSSDHEKTRKDSYSAESESDSERKHKKHKKDSRY